MSPPTHSPTRRRLPEDREAVVHKFAVGGFEGYIRVGLYEDGSLGEVFIKASKAGSTLSGMMDAFATTLSIALQYGVPLSVLADKFIETRFEPSGHTGFAEIPHATSLIDYVFRWLVLRFGVDGRGKGSAS